jgi:hypothetical protein
MGVVIEICVKNPGGRTRKKGTDMAYAWYCTVQYYRQNTPGVWLLKYVYNTPGAEPELKPLIYNIMHVCTGTTHTYIYMAYAWYCTV